MEEKKFVEFKKNEFKIKEFLKKELGKGKISEVIIEYTPIGEKIVLSTNKPGLIIGRRGERIGKITEVLKKRFGFENPHIEIQEIRNPDLDAQTIADGIANDMEKRGPLKFKTIAYRMLERIMHAGALGVEIRLSGKLPSERAKSWRFAQGYLKKVGDPAKIVDRAQAVSQTITGTVGIKVSILHPDVKIHDQIIIDENLKQKLRLTEIKLEEEIEEITKGEKEKGKKTKRKKGKEKTE